MHKGKMVLIADDEPDIVESIKYALRIEGINTMEAVDGEEALRKAKEEHPDLIVLDVMMPKMNGYKVARLLKFDAALKKIPIIMLTARTQQKDIAIGKDVRVDEYIIKPFDMKFLVDMIKQYLGK